MIFAEITAETSSAPCILLSTIETWLCELLLSTKFGEMRSAQTPSTLRRMLSCEAVSTAWFMALWSVQLCFCRSFLPGLLAVLFLLQNQCHGGDEGPSQRQNHRVGYQQKLFSPKTFIAVSYWIIWYKLESVQSAMNWIDFLNRIFQ